MEPNYTINYGYLLKLTEFGITRMTFDCNKCNQGKVSFQSGKLKHGYNKYPRCGRKNCRKWHYPFLSSLFYGTKLSYKAIYNVIEEFCNTNSIIQSSEHHYIERKTMSKYHEKFRELILLKMSDVKMSGNNTYEIDETHLYTRKYNRGRRIQGEQYWVIGIYCRETKFINLKLVEKRNRETIEIFINDSINLNEKTTIISDGWRGYMFLNLYNIKYNVVNHSINFVDATDRQIHTNGIERVWRSLKEYIPENLTIDKKLEHMRIFQFFYNKKANRFRDRFLLLIELLKEIGENEVNFF